MKYQIWIINISLKYFKADHAQLSNIKTSQINSPLTYTHFLRVLLVKSSMQFCFIATNTTNWLFFHVFTKPFCGSISGKQSNLSECIQSIQRIKYTRMLRSHWWLHTMPMHNRYKVWTVKLFLRRRAKANTCGPLTHRRFSSLLSYTHAGALKGPRSLYQRITRIVQESHTITGKWCQ